MSNSLLIFAVGPEWLVSWITTLWIIGAGALLGVIVLLLMWGILRLVHPRAAKEVPLVMTEGVLTSISYIVATAALLSILATIVVREPLPMLESVLRLPLAGKRVVTASVPADAQKFPVTIKLRGKEAVDFNMESDELVEIANADSEDAQFGAAIEVSPAQTFTWSKRKKSLTLFGGNVVDRLYVTNLSNREATVTVQMTTGPAFPEMLAMPITALAVVLLYLTYFIQAWWFPKISAVALATTKSEIAQPLFWILVSLGTFMLILFLFLPYNTFGEDIKMLKDSGLTLVMVLGIIQGVWSASNSISEEIDGRTALTVLSKPIGRRQFILGKLAGILWTVLLLFIILGVVLIVVVAYKPVYDAREMGSETPSWTIPHLEVMLTIPGLVLAFFEATVLVSLSVAISTRLPMVANFVICFSIYVLGHITPLIVQSRVQFAPVVFVGQFIATILPVLDHFNIQAAIAAGADVPYQYLLWSLFYCVLYSSIAILLALILFEDRDLA